MEPESEIASLILNPDPKLICHVFEGFVISSFSDLNTHCFHIIKADHKRRRLRQRLSQSQPQSVNHHQEGQFVNSHNFKCIYSIFNSK